MISNAENEWAINSDEEERSVEVEINEWCGFLSDVSINEILEPNSGYLVDGALKIYVEMRIDCLIGKDGIRRFNFWDPVSNWLEIQCSDWDSSLYTPKQPFWHHCEGMAEADISTCPTVEYLDPLSQSSCELFLQCVNGVMITITNSSVFVCALHPNYAAK